MNRFPMSKFGRTLTDREFGKKIAETLLQSEFPMLLDFQGVITLGSSCGDEIVSAVMSRQNGVIEVTKANPAIIACLEKVTTDLKATLRVIESPR